MLKSNRVQVMRNILEANGFVFNWNKVYNEKRKGYQRFKFFLRVEGDLKKAENELKQKFPNFISIEFHKNQSRYVIQWAKELVIKLSKI